MQFFPRYHEEKGGGERETGGNEVSSELSKEEMVPYLSSSIIRRPRGILIWSNSICEWQSQNRGGTPLSPDSHGNHPFLRSLRSVIAKPSTLVSWCSWNTSVTTVDIPDRIGPANANNELKKFGHVPRNQQSFCPWPLNRKVTINYDIKKLKSQLKISFNLINDKIIVEWMEIFIDPWIEFAVT